MSPRLGTALFPRAPTCLVLNLHRPACATETVASEAGSSAEEIAAGLVGATALEADGTHGIDLMQNGRFARNVVERAERLRDSRVAALNRVSRGSVTVADLETLRAQDILAAVADACAEKHLPIEL